MRARHNASLLQPGLLSFPTEMVILEREPIRSFILIRNRFVTYAKILHGKHFCSTIFVFEPLLWIPLVKEALVNISVEELQH